MLLDTCDSCGLPVEKWSNYCPICGESLTWEGKSNHQECPECESPVHPKFNFCWACGTEFDGEYDPIAIAKGFKLEYDCDNDECDGRVARMMSHCPWCGKPQEWDFELPRNHALYEKEKRCRKYLGLGGCGRNVDPRWYFCAFCGERLRKHGFLGISPGQSSIVNGYYTCMTCPHPQMRVRVKLKRGQRIPVCPTCGIYGRWMKGK